MNTGHRKPICYLALSLAASLPFLWGCSASQSITPPQPNPAPVPAPAPLAAANMNLIFVVSDDLLYQGAGDVNADTANLTAQGLQRTLLLAPYLQQTVLGYNDVTAI